MDRLWSPWRSQYIQTFGTDEEYSGCIFCDLQHGDKDDQNHIVKRHEHCYCVLNLYPYNSGHILLVPYQHTDTYDDLPSESYFELMSKMRIWIKVMNSVLRPQGFNLGSNIGRVAGAGIDQHIHMHIVPRWSGDMNFMPIIGDTKIISESMSDTAQKLREGYDALFAGTQHN